MKFTAKVALLMIRTGKLNSHYKYILSIMPIVIIVIFHTITLPLGLLIATSVTG